MKWHISHVWRNSRLVMRGTGWYWTEWSSWNSAIAVTDQHPAQWQADNLKRYSKAEHAAINYLGPAFNAPCREEFIITFAIPLPDEPWVARLNDEGGWL